MASFLAHAVWRMPLPLPLRCSLFLRAQRTVGLAAPSAVGTMGRTLQNRIFYHHVYQDRKVCVGVFVAPHAGARMPLHDHPQMVVLSKLLWGSARLTAYDYAQQSAGTAALTFSGVISSPSVSVLTPSHGNLHEIEAVSSEGFGMLDVQSPPYDPPSGRDCTYLRVVSPPGEVPVSAGAVGALVTLQRYRPPSSEFSCTEAPYTGPRVESSPLFKRGVRR